MDDGGLAFPVASDVIGHQTGISLRDWFAGMALPTLIANKETTYTQDVLNAYMIADAMLRARDGGDE